MNFKELKEAAKRATPGPWDVWEESTPTKDQAIDELAYQVSHTPDEDFAEAVYLLNADGKCPALTGCGPTSKANAEFIALANPSTILSLIARVEQMEEALTACAVILPRYHMMGATLGQDEEHSAVLERVLEALETPANPIEEVVDATRQD